MVGMHIKKKCSIHTSHKKTMFNQTSQEKEYSINTSQEKQCTINKCNARSTKAQNVFFSFLFIFKKIIQQNLNPIV